jgi:hypothetical protein
MSNAVGSLEWIEDNVIGYFSDRFDTPASKFDESTNCFSLFKFELPDWRSLGDVFNNLDWVEQINSHITHQEMQECKTIGLISKKLLKNIPKKKVPIANEIAFTQVMDVLSDSSTKPVGAEVSVENGEIVIQITGTIKIALPRSR